MPELEESPRLSTLYVKAAASAPFRRGGELPGSEYVRRDIKTDRDHLAAYNRVCGFALRDELPLTYPHVLAFGMAVRLMTDPGFPFPLMGLVHVANTIWQHRPVLVTDVLTQRVRVENARPHRKGRQFDVVTETSVADPAGDSVVWREVSTYLRRGATDESAPRERREINGGALTASWSVPGDLGRRYAAVSGDRNPIHLTSLAAKAFGFPRAIAHGMWSKARCVAAFEGRLPDSCTVEVDFARPVLLPSTVDFSECPIDGGWNFSLRSRSGKPHLLGTLRGA